MNQQKTNAIAPQEFSLISNETLLALHRNLLICRARARPTKPARRALRNAAKYDAVLVAVTQGLVDGDHVRSTARPKMIEVLRVRPNSASRKAQFAEPNFAAMLESALAAALANKTGKTGRATVVFGGETNEAAWGDALEAARVHILPIVFVGIIDLAKERRDHAQLRSELAPGTELARITVDGNDVVAVYRVAHEAIERARRDRGPSLIECAEYRLRGRAHADPVANMEAYLRGKGLLPLASGRRQASWKSPRRSAG